MSTDTVSSCRDFHRPHVPCGALTAATVSAVTVLDWLPEPLQPVAMRMARADELIFELAQVAFAWSRGPNGEGPLELRQVERRPGVLDVEVTSIRPVPPAASALFSEVVHHMRSALDNTVFFLVEAARGGPLTGHQVRAVSMPICDDEKVFQNNVGKLAKKGIHELDVDTTLGQRVASLQPFADPVAVPAISPLLAAEMGDPNPDQQHPLVLLRDYSNEDKHRAFRIAACRALIQSSRDLKGTRRMGMRPIAVGDVVDVVRKDVPELMDIFSALHVQRPNGVWVSPVAELDHIWQHVAYVFDGTDHRLFVDGVERAVGQLEPNNRTSTSGWIGTRDGKSDFYAGALDRIRIWTSAQTAAQIEADRAGAAPDPAGLAVELSFDEDDELIAYDRSGRGNDAILGDGVTRWAPERRASDRPVP